jgi:tRNA-uridine 2-sulfurtransferase
MKAKNHTKVIVAMSGGVDSSVSAALLKKRGFDVTGMFMKCWSADDPLGENCTSTDDERMARLAAIRIGIPFYSINLVDEYKKKVVKYLLDGYKKGITPNPDVMCNKEIKFGLFFEKAMDLGADFVATGHYAQIVQEGRTHKILAGKDPKKDQSYFLSFINPKLLPRILFPIGEYKKTEVRKMARKFGLPNADRKDSQGVCFVGKIDFAEFLKQYIPAKIGKIVDSDGNVLGEHEGAYYYTIGQRKGIGLSGGPYYVVGTDLKRNRVVVSRNERDLYTSEVKVKNLNWFAKPSKQDICASIRYRQNPSPGTFSIDKLSKAGKLVFKEPQRAVTPGQLAVLYQGEQMLAGGVIAK